MVRKIIIAVLIFICLGFFGECIARIQMHEHGGPPIINLPANTLQNKYQWRCLDISTNPLYVKNCDNSPAQTNFAVELLQQSYNGCNPVQILGPDETIPSDCLSAPIKEGDPVTVIPCLVPTVEQIQGITWSFLTTMPPRLHSYK
ncbi:409_t:CDS:2 [Cetraspora pellucida]|uniref:409_t:CDS:1 n=1 Tax=Cetraspora pellucida TaxID=1433469 RepID=A0A9N9F3E3_9GLOM|nr:409_t:CDS:2 [Cetraspora pellucida]